ncbi:MAG: hypothetical protein OES57_12180 [Acidimicrobiia bacterium]|nr:hypothetical protein [Acidimicrobiia bacterium]
MSIRLWRLLGGVAALLAAVSVVSIPSSGSEPGVVRTLDGPRVVSAGDEVIVDVEASGSGPIVVAVIGGAAALELQVDVVDGAGRLVLPPALTRTAGRLTLVSGSEHHDIEVVPGPAHESPALTGPRTIVADGVDRTLAVAAPTDRYGNPVADGTEVTLTRTGPGRRTTMVTIASTGGLAWQPFVSGTVAGRSRVWARTGSRSSVAAVVDEVPGAAVAVEVVAPDGVPAADGRSSMMFATRRIVDEHGNVVPDGVAGVFVIGTADAAHEVPAVVQNGRLRARWVVPGEPARLTVRAVVNGVSSEAVERTTASALDDLPVRVDAGAAGIDVRVGPLVGIDGALVADGTRVSVNGVEVMSRDGRARVTLVDRPSTVTVGALGVTTTVAVTT